MIKDKRVRIIVIGAMVIVGGLAITKIFGSNGNVETVISEPVEIVNEEDNKVELYLEHVEKVNVSIFDLQEFVFYGEDFDLHETWGESAKTNVTVAGSFKAKYSLATENSKYVYNPEKDIFEYYVNENDLKISSVEPISEIKEIGRNETLFDKMKDSIPFVDSNNEERKETAINRLLNKSKEKAKKPVNELKQLVEPKILNELKKYQTEDKHIEIIWTKE